MIRVESITNAGEHFAISYAHEVDVDYKSGIVESRICRIPLDAVPQELIEEFVDVAVQILDAARVHKHQVADSFTGPR